MGSPSAIGQMPSAVGSYNTNGSPPALSSGVQAALPSIQDPKTAASLAIADRVEQSILGGQPNFQDAQALAMLFQPQDRQQILSDPGAALTAAQIVKYSILGPPTTQSGSSMGAIPMAPTAALPAAQPVAAQQTGPSYVDKFMAAGDGASIWDLDPAQLMADVGPQSAASNTAQPAATTSAADLIRQNGGTLPG